MITKTGQTWTNLPKLDPSLRVAVLMGGPSSEREISLVSGKQVLSSLEAHRPIAVEIGRDGSWSVGGVLHRNAGLAVDDLKQRAEVVFIAMHGELGEDGTIQGLLDSVGLRYAGSGVLGSALAMDKVRAKLVYKAVGIPSAPFRAISPRDLSRGLPLAEELGRELGFPCAVKPARAGSSVGVTFPKSDAELARDLGALAGTDGLVLVEGFVKGREFTCGVIAFEREGRLVPLPVTEIIPDKSRFEFFDYVAKYTPGATREVTPAQIPDALTERIQALAVEAHRWLDCRDMSRSDFIVSDTGELVILETNTIPGLTPQSLLPQAAAVAGLSFYELVSILIDDALSRR
ncbi:MAG: D-alanine--D-alanine ligase [Deltaproteobacteria bacterium]|nr:D-alanine--D-alanine ligase [Deltaproteobacteria bacterium]